MGVYMGVTDASKKWGYTPETIRKWCREGIIKDVEQDASGRPWRIPSDAICPRKIKSNHKTQK